MTDNRTNRLRWMLAAAIIVLAVFSAYSNTFFGPRMIDDDLATTSNASIRHLWKLWNVLSPPVNLPVVGRPILNLSFAINYAISKNSIWSYHVFNLLVHEMAALVVFDLVRRFFLLPALRARFGGDALLLGFTVALLWALHPVQTVAVSYLSERAESMMGLFYLLTIYGVLRVSQAETARERKYWSVACSIACLLGMLTKEVMVTAPVMALLFDRTFLAGTFREAWRLRWKLYVWLATPWVYYFFSWPSVAKFGVGLGYNVTPWQYLLTQCKAVFLYTTLIVWPHPVVADFGMEEVAHPLEVLPQALVQVCWLVLTAIAFFRYPKIGFAGVWFFLILAPTSTVIPIPGSPLGEHRLYVAMLGVLTLIVAGLYWWLGRNYRFPALAAAFTLGILTHVHNEIYQSVVLFNEYDLTYAPENERMLVAMGGCFYDMGNFDAATAEYDHALRLRPDDPRALAGLGAVLSREHRTDEAIQKLKESIQLDPSFTDAYYNLGETLSQAGHVNEAISYYQQAIALDPDTSKFHYNLGRALARLGRRDDAIVQFQLALQQDPDDIDACVYLGGVLAQEGHFEEAIPCFKHALSLDPQNVDAHNDMGITLALAGQKDEAAREFREALRLDPNYSKARVNLAQLERKPPDRAK